LLRKLFSTFWPFSLDWIMPLCNCSLCNCWHQDPTVSLSMISLPMCLVLWPHFSDLQGEPLPGPCQEVGDWTGSETERNASGNQKLPCQCDRLKSLSPHPWNL
jgi:hypothetical protein